MNSRAFEKSGARGLRIIRIPDFPILTRAIRELLFSNF
jgi:hypothetical protein